MKFKLSSIKHAPVLFVKPYGDGKLLVRDVHSTLCQGVSLTIVPILSLSADQRKKVTDKANQSCGRIISIHLDEIKDRNIANEIIQIALLLPRGYKKDNSIICISVGYC